MKLHLAALRHRLCLMITNSYLPPTRFIRARVEPHLVIYIRNLQQQSPTFYYLLNISPTHERIIACVKLESANGS